MQEHLQHLPLNEDKQRTKARCSQFFCLSVLFFHYGLCFGAIAKKCLLNPRSRRVSLFFSGCFIGLDFTPRSIIHSELILVYYEGSLSLVSDKFSSLSVAWSEKKSSGICSVGVIFNTIGKKLRD